MRQEGKRGSAQCPGETSREAVLACPQGLLAEPTPMSPLCTRQQCSAHAILGVGMLSWDPTPTLQPECVTPVTPPDLEMESRHHTSLLCPTYASCDQWPYQQGAGPVPHTRDSPS